MAEVRGGARRGRREWWGVGRSRGQGAFGGVRLGRGRAGGGAGARGGAGGAGAAGGGGARGAGAGGTQILSASDARVGELYVGRFGRVDGLPVARDAERVCAPVAVALPEGLQAYGTGTGFGAADGALVAQLGAGLRGVDAAVLPRVSDALALAVPAFARVVSVVAE